MKLLVDPRGSRVLAVFDHYGSELHLMARILTDDQELAERVVIQAIAAHHSGPCTLRQLSAAVYVAWAAWGPHPRTSASLAPVDDSAAEAQLYEFHGLQDDQRAALGLCRFGGHTYRQAALVMGLPADHVAELLCAAMRNLARPRSMPARIA
ncbi:hypothetical protein [Aeromicrobium sp.]|uniref:hypothetical protein n=1 Tax=Aeromicrobium sp. TaxID=1871063 RepID=UPI0030C5BD2B